MPVYEFFAVSLLLSACVFWATIYALRAGWIKLPQSTQGQQAVRELHEELREAYRRIEDLERELEEQKKKSVNQQQIINTLLSRLVYMEQSGQNGAKVKQNAPPHRPARPLYVICAGDDLVCRRDLVALRKARIPFKREINATKDLIEAELQRRRHNDDLPPWIHIAAHSSPEGIHLIDGVAGPEWWQSVLSNVEIVFLNGCQTLRVADDLAGFIPHVIAVSEDINNDDAEAFTYAFWRRIWEGESPADAYNDAIRSEVPQVAEYTDFRRS